MADRHGALVKHQGPDPRLRAVADDYMKQTGKGTPGPAPPIVPVDIRRARMAARDFADMPETHDELTLKAYAAMAKEVAEQYHALRLAGYRFHFYDPEKHDPYAKGPSAATDDLRENKKMGVFPTEVGFGSGAEGVGSAPATELGKRHPLMADTGERWGGKRVLANDMFRAVHDAMGHAKQGIGFRGPGEENAFRQHAQMFDPLARMALASETRGQNSWLNYGPYGSMNQKARTVDEPVPADKRAAVVRAGGPGGGHPGTIFSDQKAGIMPVRSITSGTEDFLPPDHPERLAEIARRYGRPELARLRAAGGQVKTGPPKPSPEALRKATEVARSIGNAIGPVPAQYARGGRLRRADGGAVPGDVTQQPSAFAGYRSSLQADGDHPERISQRLPSTQKNENAITGNLMADTESAAKSPETHAHNARLLAQYPGMPAQLRHADADPEEILTHFHQLAGDNLRFMHDAMPPEIRERSKLWYKGGRNIVDRFAKRYNMPDSAVAGVLASLSPQKDWYQNVSLAERVLDALHNQHNLHYTSEMEDHANRIFFKDTQDPMLDNIRGKRLADISDPKHKAMFIRLHDEAHNPRWHRLVTPEGNFGRVRTKNDELTNDDEDAEPPEGAHGITDASQTSWGSLSEITKAVSAAQSNGSKRALSELMGARHKVRNFYNNLLAPDAPHGDVTIDTHAIAANLIRALGGSATEVSHNFQNSVQDPYDKLVEEAKRKGLPKPRRSDVAKPVAAKGSDVTGVRGTYPYHADALRRTAADLKLLPRELQSITWEGVRGLFTPEQKRDKKLVAAVDGIWDNVTHGRLTADKAREQIMTLARTPTDDDKKDPDTDGKLKNPSWFKSGRSGDSPPERTWDTSYERNVSGRGPHGAAAEMAPGTGGGPSGAPSGLDPEEVASHGRARTLNRAVRAAHGAAGRVGGLPGTYGRRAKGSGEVDLAPDFGAKVKNTYEPHAEARKTWDAAGISAPTMHELAPGRASAAAFHGAVSGAANAAPDKTIMDVRDPSHYAGMRLFMSPDKSSGFALDGDHIHSVFNHHDGPHENATNSMLDLAVNQGGRRLIAHGDVLPAVYSRNRFQATAKHGMAGGLEMTHMVYSPGKHDFYNSREGAPVADFAAADKLQARASKTSLARIRKQATDDEIRQKMAAKAADYALKNPDAPKKKPKKAHGGAIGASGPEIDRAMAAARHFREARA